MCRIGISNHPSPSYRAPGQSVVLGIAPSLGDHRKAATRDHRKTGTEGRSRDVDDASERVVRRRGWPTSRATTSVDWSPYRGRLQAPRPGRSGASTSERVVIHVDTLLRTALDVLRLGDQSVTPVMMIRTSELSTFTAGVSSRHEESGGRGCRCAGPVARVPGHQAAVRTR